MLGIPFPEQNPLTTLQESFFLMAPDVCLPVCQLSRSFRKLATFTWKVVASNGDRLKLFSVKCPCPVLERRLVDVPVLLEGKM